MNEKVLWKIEELWKKYYSLSLQGVKQSHYWHSDLKERISFLYKNNISIYNPDFQRVIEFDFTQSKKPVHSDDYGEYLGLEKSQVLEKNSKLIYLFDNHNKIIQPFLEYAEIRGKSFYVVHIDAHADDAIYPFKSPKSLDLRNTTNYILRSFLSFTLLVHALYQRQYSSIKNILIFDDFRKTYIMYIKIKTTKQSFVVFIK